MTALGKGKLGQPYFWMLKLHLMKCWHDGLRYKIRESLGLPDRLVRVLSSFLTDRTLQVVEQGLFSTSFQLTIYPQATKEKQANFNLQMI